MDISTINALFLTDGLFSWLILIGFVLLIGTLGSFENKIIQTLSVPISVILALTYLTNNLGWHALIMFIAAIGVIIYIAKKN